MEFRLNTEHRITISEAMLATITRVPLNGGVPKSISVQLESDITFKEAMDKITRLATLDNELFNMLWESQQNATD